LQIDVPAQFWSGATQVRIKGVKVGLKLKSDDEGSAKGKRKAAKGDQTPSNPNSQGNDVLPSIKEVAKEFLEAEPEEELHEIEVAIQSQSIANVEDSTSEASEEEQGLGTGFPISAYGYIEGAIKGIIDRLEVVIEDVTFSVHFDVPVDSPLEMSGEDEVDSSLRFHLEKLEVEGFTSRLPGINRRGKRQIVFRQITGDLTSSTAVFASLERIASFGTRGTSNSQPTTSQDSHSSPESHLMGSSTHSLMDSALNPMPSSSTKGGLSSLVQKAEGTEALPDEPIHPDDRFADVSDEEDEGHQFLLSSGFQSRKYTTLPEEDDEMFPFDMDVSGLQKSKDSMLNSPQKPTLERSRLRTSNVQAQKTQHSDSSSSSSSAGEDLSESRYFTHEEAQSMYQSAMSEIPQRSSPILGRDPAHVPHTSDPHVSEIPTPTRSPQGKTGFTEAVPTTESHQRSPQSTLDQNTRVTKSLLSIDQIAILMPWAGQEIREDIDTESTGSSIDQSTDFQMPGAFSDHRPAKVRSANPAQAQPEADTPGNVHQQHSTSKRKQDADQNNNVEIDIGNAEGMLDLSSGKVLFALIKQVLQPLQRTAEPKPAASNTPLTSESSTKSLALNIKHLRLSLQEHLSRLLHLSQATAYDSVRFSQNSILTLDARDNELSLKVDSSISSAKLSIRQFCLGFPNESLIGFEAPSTQMSADSRADLAGEQQGSLNHDISVIYQCTEERGQELHVNTRQLSVDLSLPKIDEKLTSYGGLSGILDLSNSIASNSTMLASPGGKSFPTTSPEMAQSGMRNDPLKINLRVGGVRFTIQGRECGVTLYSSPVKAIVRENIITARTSHVQFKGPIQASDPLTIDVLGSEFSLLDAPEEIDLTLLLSLLMPSRDPYEDDDDILLDTFLRQRKNGSLIRATINEVQLSLYDLSVLQQLQSLSKELSKFQNVANYLPDDDRPGVLTLLEVRNLQSQVALGEAAGMLTTDVTDTRLAHVGLPALLALKVGNLAAYRNKVPIVHQFLSLRPDDQLPMVMGKIIGDEIEPTIKLKFFNIVVEYKVSTLMAFLGVPNQATAEDLAASMAQSVATIRGGFAGSGVQRQSSGFSDSMSDSKAKPLQVNILLRDCAIGLNPTGLPSRGLFLLSETQFSSRLSSESPLRGKLELRKGSLHLIDDVDLLDEGVEVADRSPLISSRSLASEDLLNQGYQSVASISSATATFNATESENGKSLLTIDSSNELILLETCADSTQTLIQMIDALKPPSTPEQNPQYRLNPMVPQDLMDSFCGEAFDQEEDSVAYDGTEDPDYENELRDDISDDQFEMVGSFYSSGGSEDGFGTFSSPRGKRSTSRRTPFPDPRKMKPTRRSPFSSARGFRLRSPRKAFKIKSSPNHLEAESNFQKIRSWNSTSKRQDLPKVKFKDCPLTLRLQVTTFIWNLFDGYDWLRTREVISDAVDKVQEKAAQRLSARRRSQPDFDDDESQIGDTLFQSIWISVPANQEEHDLRRRINRDVDVISDETGTITTAITPSDTSHRRRPRKKTLRLERSRRHKVSIEIRNLDSDINVLPPLVVETQSIIDVRVEKFEIYDHVPTSSWRKFLTLLLEEGPPPYGTPMLHLEIQNIKPDLQLSATELVIIATLLPLRLHVDQDTLDFITRFFEFKDDSRVPSGIPTDPPFIQRCEVRALPLKLDYKPKKVDYAGLRSGRTKEFMNFVTLEDADIVLRRLVLYGVTGFDNLHKSLNDIWVADVVGRQLPTVIQGLAPIRPLVNVGKGLLQLIVVPIEEWQKDGRVVRGIRKGIFAFAKTTSSEVARLGGKIAMGTGTLLSEAQTLLSPSNTMQDYDPMDQLSGSLSSGSHRAVSAYANQPLTIPAGVRSGLAHLERELASMQDGIIAVGTDVQNRSTLSGKALALAGGAPVLILKPLIGGTRAIGTTLLGAANQLDPNSRRKLEDVSCFVVVLS
jgi:autophagy-related protein 2